MTELELCEVALGKMKDGVIQDQVAKGIRASGESADSLKTAMGNDGGELLGSDKFYYQIYGRKPGKMPPIRSILEWIESKGITPASISKERFAYLIARKIANMGTRIFRKETPGLALNEIVVEQTKTLGKGIGTNAVESILDIFRTLNTKK